MTTQRRPLLRLRPVLLPVILVLHSAQADHVPIQYKITSRQTECIYDQFLKSDVVTFSVFVIEALNNGKPRASVTFEGPVAGNKELLPRYDRQGNIINYNDNDNNDNEDGLQRAGRQRGKMTTGRDIRSSLVSDWPKIRGPHSPNGVIERKFKVDWTHAGESEDATAARAAILEKTHDEFRQHKLEHADKHIIDVPPVPLHTIAQSSIDPYQETKEITAQGWYRLCVISDFMPLIVEMDMRSADKLKGINPATGHVYTYEQRAIMDEQVLLMSQREEGAGVYDTKDGHNQVKHEDFTESKTKLKYLHDLTSEIVKSQHQRLNRVKAHDADARRGAAELAWSSKFETFLYVMIMGVQVYTVQKWLLGHMQLGK